jgi:DNA-binding LytR/AlgR family response regulator
MKNLNQSDIISLKRQKLGKLSIPTIEGFLILELNNILYLQSDNSYTTIFLSDNSKVTSSRNLGFFEDILLPEPFLRVHNSFIINLNKVVKYIRGDDGYIILNNGTPIRVSRSKRDELLEFFSIARSKG